MTDSYTHPADASTKPTLSIQEERDLFEGHMAKHGIRLKRMEDAPGFYANEAHRMAWAGWLARARLER